MKTGLTNQLIVLCKTLYPDQEKEYNFLHVVSSKDMIFYVSMTCRSLENSNFKEIYKDLVKHVEDKRWINKDGGMLGYKILWSRINTFLKGFDNEKSKIKENAKNIQPLSVQREYKETEANDANRVVETIETAKSQTKWKTTPRDGRGTPNAREGKKGSWKIDVAKKAKELEDGSMASVITTLPRDVQEGEEINYKESKKIYEDYWISCTDLYFGGVEKMYQILIDQLETPLEHLNVWCIEEKGILSALKYYLEMPDPSKKMTLCAMPQDLLQMPKSFEEVASGKL